MATHWFDRYRGRVVATVLTAGGIVGFLVTWYNTRMLHVASWRTGFTSYAILALLLAGIARIFIRNTPEELGQNKDGIDTSPRNANLNANGELSEAKKIRRSVLAVFVF